MYMHYLQAFVMLTYQVSSLLTNSSHISVPGHAKTHLETYLFPNIVIVFDVSTILISVLIMNYLIIPYLPPSMSMKKRIGFGMLLNIAALVAAAAVEGGTHTSSHERQLLWLLLPGILLALGEVVIFVTGK